MEVAIVSDWHLGADLCQRRSISRFLDGLPSSTKTLIINGDLVEHAHVSFRRQDWAIFSQLKSLSKYRRLVWVRGNHDPDNSSLAHLIGAEYVNAFKFVQEDREFYCTHGDRWDTFIKKHPILTWIGDSIYLGIMRLNKGIARYLKHKNKQVLHCRNHVARGALELIYTHGYSAVCCGHTHHAEQIGDQYYNSGSWTDESCTYLLARNGAIVLKEFNA